MANSVAATKSKRKPKSKRCQDSEIPSFRGRNMRLNDIHKPYKLSINLGQLRQIVVDLTNISYNIIHVNGNPLHPLKATFSVAITTRATSVVIPWRGRYFEWDDEVAATEKDVNNAFGLMTGAILSDLDHNGIKYDSDDGTFIYDAKDYSDQNGYINENTLDQDGNLIVFKYGIQRPFDMKYMNLLDISYNQSNW